jgi:hypothetical protein
MRGSTERSHTPSAVGSFQVCTSLGKRIVLVTITDTRRGCLRRQEQYPHTQYELVKEQDEETIRKVPAGAGRYQLSTVSRGPDGKSVFVTTIDTTTGDIDRQRRYPYPVYAVVEEQE